METRIIRVEQRKLTDHPLSPLSPRAYMHQDKICSYTTRSLDSLLKSAAWSWESYQRKSRSAMKVSLVQFGSST